MNGVGFKMSGRTSVPKWPPSYPLLLDDSVHFLAKFGEYFPPILMLRFDHVCQFQVLKLIILTVYRDDRPYSPVGWTMKQGTGYKMSRDMTKPTKWLSLIRVFAVRMKKALVLSYSLSAQRRLWSDWADAQADLSLRWAHSHFVGFVMSRLRYFRVW